MSAASTDKITNVSNGTRPVSTTVSTIRSAGVTTLACADLTGWATDTAVHFVTYKVNGQGVIVAGSQTDWKGIVSGNTISNLSVTGGTDAGNAVGDIVEILPTARWAKELTDALRVSLNQDGTIKTGAVTSTALAANAVTAAAITDANVTTSKLADANVTPVKWTNQYKFGVYYTGTQAIAGTTAAAVQFNTSLFDSNSNYNTTTFRYTAPVAGFYYFSSAVNCGPVNGNSRQLISLYKNGVETLRGMDYEVGNNVATPQVVVSGLLQLAAGDYVQVFYNNQDSVSRNVNGGQAVTYFQGFLVSQT